MIFTKWIVIFNWTLLHMANWEAPSREMLALDWWCLGESFGIKRNIFYLFVRKHITNWGNSTASWEINIFPNFTWSSFCSPKLQNSYWLLNISTMFLAKSLLCRPLCSFIFFKVFTKFKLSECILLFMTNSKNVLSFVL